jgi:hypothetical protein
MSAWEGEVSGHMLKDLSPVAKKVTGPILTMFQINGIVKTINDRVFTQRSLVHEYYIL